MERSPLRRATDYLGVTIPTATPTQVRASDGAIPPARPTRSVLTTDAALSLAAVYRSVQIIVTAVSQMPLSVYRSNTPINPPALIRQPSLADTQRGFVAETVYSLAVHGNAYWRLYGDPVHNIKVLDPDEVAVAEDYETGRVSYFVRGAQVPSDQIKHLKLTRRPGQVEGVGPIQAARGELQAALRLREFADTWFDTSGVPTGVLSTDAQLNPDESAAFAEAWKAFLETHGGTAVLSQGLSYKPLNIKPAEAQFLEVQQASVANIARLFGIPATYLLAELNGSSTTYSNQRDQNLIFLQFTLTAYVNEIEDALSSLLPRGQVVEFEESQLMRMTPELRVDLQVKQVGAGLRTANELRAEDRLPPLPEPEQKEVPSSD